MKIRIFAIMLLCFALTACGNQEKINEKPELAPICPEGRHWIDTSKSCEILETEMLP